jgi:hypothetical protein
VLFGGRAWVELFEQVNDGAAIGRNPRHRRLRGDEAGLLHIEDDRRARVWQPLERDVETGYVDRHHRRDLSFELRRVRAAKQMQGVQRWHCQDDVVNGICDTAPKGLPQTQGSRRARLRATVLGWRG